jgi:hypothetical protein
VQHPIGILPHPRSKHAMRFTALRKSLLLDQLSYGADGLHYRRNRPCREFLSAQWLEFRTFAMTL